MLTIYLIFLKTYLTFNWNGYLILKFYFYLFYKKSFYNRTYSMHNLFLQFNKEANKNFTLIIFSFERRMNPSHLLFNISINISKIIDLMNRVSPILDDENESSVDTIQRKLQLRACRPSLCQEIGGTRTCKICLEEETVLPNETPQDEQAAEKQMIIPCQCRGSVGYVHQKCIKMWIRRQQQGNKSKRAYCEICKSQIFFKKIKIRFCDCHLNNICQTTPCNAVCVVAQIILIAIVGLIQYYVDRLMNFPLLRNTLLALLAILCVTFFLTIFLILKQSFVKSYREIQKIYSLAESEQLGFREPRCRQQPVNHATNVNKKRRFVVNKKERRSGSTRNPLNPFQSISPQLVLGFNG